MGASNVGLTYAQWGHLPDRQHRVLTYMALISMDARPLVAVDSALPPPCRYWGGWESLYAALGRDVPAAPDPDDTSFRARDARRVRRAAHESVRSTVAALVKTGALTRVRAGGRGRQAEYALTLTPLWVTTASTDPQGQADSAPEGQADSAPEGQAGSAP